MKYGIIILFIITVFYPAYAQEKMSLSDLQKSVLERSPRILSMRKEIEMSEKRISLSTSLEDPKLKLGVNNVPANSFSFTKEDMTSKEIGVSQMIPLGKFGTRKNIASLEYDKAKERYILEKTDLLHMLRMNAYELVYIRSSIGILSDIKNTLKLLIDSEVAANKAGMGSLSNVIKANIEFNMIDEEIITLGQKEKKNIQTISYLVGSDTDIDFNSLPLPDKTEPSSETVIKQVFSSNPELAIFKLDAEISRYQITQKKEEYIPDVEIGASYMQRQNGSGMKRDDMVSGMVTFNIPVWSLGKNQSMIDEMTNKTEAAEAQYKDKQNDLSAKAEIMISNIIKWRDLYTLFSQKLIPQTELALETSMARYKANTGEFMPVIDTVRMLLRYKKESAMALTEYHVSVSELNKLMGVEVVQ